MICVDADGIVLRPHRSGLPRDDFANDGHWELLEETGATLAS